MSTEIKIKRGSGITPALADGELGYNKDTKTLTIGTNGTVTGNVNVGRPIETVPQEDYDSYVSEGTVDKDTIYIIESDDAVVTQSVLEECAAPSGFGLGGKSKQVTDWNDAKANGWYCDYSTAANSPFPQFACWGRVDAFGLTDDAIIQTAYTYTTDDWSRDGIFEKKRYYKTTTGWSEWEWVNPPMTLGREYRTTERYNGKPVYVKTFSASFNSTSAVGTVKDLLIPHGLPNHYIVRVEATAGTYMFPSIMDRDSFTSIYTIDATDITIRICDDNWRGSIRFTLYYTKD